MTKILVDVALNNYAHAFSSPELPVLAELNRETYLKMSQPVMLSGHLQGNLLQMLSCMIRPKRILELGTFTGYSAICLAQGLQDGGHLHTIDIDEELEDICHQYFEKAGIQDRVTMHFGKAMDIIPQLNETFDLVFLDADKPNYSTYYDMLFDSIPIGGYIIADNVLFEGAVMLPENEQCKNSKAMHAFNLKIKKDKRVEKVLLPLRDGLTIMRKIAVA
jgi:caffeoyl-CoA O-methyltransferase